MFLSEGAATVISFSSAKSCYGFSFQVRRIIARWAGSSLGSMAYLGDRDLRVEARAMASTITPYQSPSQERDKHVYRHVRPMLFRTY